MKTKADLDREFFEEEAHIEAVKAFLKLRGLSPTQAAEISLMASVKIRYFEREDPKESLSQSIEAVINRLKSLQLIAKRQNQLGNN